MSDSRERTVRTTGSIVKYSREINRLDSVSEAANLALEAVPQVIEGHPSAAVVEVRGDSLRVRASMLPTIAEGEGPDRELPVTRARDQGTVVVCAGGETEVVYEDEHVERLDLEEFGESKLPPGSVTVAAPTVYGEAPDEHGAILVVHWPSLSAVEEYHVKPVAYFADHLATAITNIRSREELERARHDLETRKEMVEVYDSLLRHDLGNDIQIIRGYADALSVEIQDGQEAEYVEKICRTAESASHRIESIGKTVKTLEDEAEPTDRALEPVLSGVVREVEAKFESLAVEYDPDEFDYQVYAGDLLDSVFANIISNAAVHNEGSVTVDLSAEGLASGGVTVSVADDGAGIPEAARDDILEMGEKGPDSNGSGFGLGLARTLVDSYGGDIAVRESDRGGADFRVTLDRV